MFPISKPGTVLDYT